MPTAETVKNDFDDGAGSGVLGEQDLSLEVSGWSRAAARSFLRLRFEDHDRYRLGRLEAKAAQTALTAAELAELDGYREVAAFIESMKLSARRYLIRPEAAEVPCTRSADSHSPTTGRSRPLRSA